MNAPTIHGYQPALTASAIRQAVGDELSLIRQQDGLTWADLGDILGKSEDQAAKYADGSAEMGIVAYAKAKRQWNGRFTGSLDRLVEASKPKATDDRACETSILKAALALSLALEDGKVDPHEVRANRATLETARDAIEAQPAKLSPRSAA